MFNVGMGTVRVAIKILKVMGYVAVIQGKGTYITDGSPSTDQNDSQIDKALESVSLADLMKACEIVECEAAFLAAKAADDERNHRAS